MKIKSLAIAAGLGGLGAAAAGFIVAGIRYLVRKA
jgi:hypothetical protein